MRPTPDKFTRVPGLLNEITDWIERSDPHPDRPMAFAAALSAFSLAISGKVRFLDVDPETRVLAIAPSGAGKTLALQRAVELLRRAGFGDSIHDGFASPEAVRDLRGRGKPILWRGEHFDQWVFREKRFADFLEAAFDNNGRPVVFHGQCSPEGFDKACRASKRFLDFAMESIIIAAAPNAAARIAGGANANAPDALVEALARWRDDRNLP